MNVLGVDFSLNGTGLCLYNGKSVISTSVFSLKKSNFKEVILIPDKPLFEKLDWVCNEIIEYKNYDFVCMEDHLGSYYDWMDGYAIIKHYLRKKEVPYISIAPASLKKYATTSGRADKIQMAYYLRNEFKFDFDYLGDLANNIVDATWLAIVGYTYYSQEKNLTNERKLILDKIRKKVEKGRKSDTNKSK